MLSGPASASTSLPSAEIAYASVPQQDDLSSDYLHDLLPEGSTMDAPSSYMERNVPADTPPMDAGEAPCTTPKIPLGILTVLIFSAMAQNFSFSGLMIYMNMDLNMEPVALQQYWVVLGLVAWVQPLIGWLSDSFVVCGEKRRPLFVVAGVVNAIIFVLFYMYTEGMKNFTLFVSLSVVSQVCTMSTYIPLNGLLVELGQNDALSSDEGIARLSSIMSQAMMYRSIGSLVGSILQTLILFFFTVRAMLMLSSMMFLVVCLLMVLLVGREHFSVVHEAVTSGDADGNTDTCSRIRSTCQQIKKDCTPCDLQSDACCFAVVLMFVFFYTVMPDGSSVYSSYLYAVYSFPAWFYSLNGVVGSLGATLGAWFYSLWMDYRTRSAAEHGGVSGGPLRTSAFFIFAVGSISWALAYVTNIMLCTGIVTDDLHIPAQIFIPVDTFLVSICVRFAFMPTLTMAAEHAPKRLEATAFEVFSVASMAGGTLSSLITAFMAQWLEITRSDYSNLPLLLWVSMACKLVPIPLAKFLPARKPSASSGALGGAQEVVIDDDEDQPVVI